MKKIIFWFFRPILSQQKHNNIKPAITVYVMDHFGETGKDFSDWLKKPLVNNWDLRSD